MNERVSTSASLLETMFVRRTKRSLFRLLTLALVATTFLAFAAPAWAAPGDLDTTFGTSGKVKTDFNSAVDQANDVAIQPDGKIVAAGGSRTEASGFQVARYNSNGSLDASFDGDGKLTTDITPFSDEAQSVAVQPDGKIVVAGNAAEDWGLARYNADGSLDTSFGNAGTRIADFGTTMGRQNYGEAFSLAIQPDGKIVAAGSISIWEHNPITGVSTLKEDFGFIRYNPDGTVDGTFGDGGTVRVGVATGYEQANEVVIQPDGKIVAAGFGITPTRNSFGTLIFPSDFALVRLNSNGTLDTSFDGDGSLRTNFPSGHPDSDYSQAYDLVIQPDGKLVAGGRANTYDVGNGNAPSDFALARYNPDGSLDNSFDGDGRVKFSTVGGYDEARAIALQTNGKLLAAGVADMGSTPQLENYDFTVVRLNANGTPDMSFGSSGKVFTDMGTEYNQVRALAVQPDGKVVAAGFAGDRSNPNVSDFALARYQGDPLDTTAPTVSATSPVDGATNVAVSTNVTVTFSEAMDPATVSADNSMVWKEGTTAPVAASVTYDAVAKKATLNPAADLEASTTYLAGVRGGTSGVKDRAGNTLAADRVWSFTTATAVDATAPTVSLTAPADGAIVSGPVVALSADAQDNVGVSKVEFRVDGNLVGTDTTAPYSANLNSENFSDGRKSVTAKAFDAAGNQKTSTARQVVVDNFFPNTTITAGPAEGSLARSTSASFSFSATDSAGGFRCKLDDRTTEPCSSGKSYSGLSQGRHTFSVWAIGSAGETIDTEPSPAIRTWTVDSVKPRGTVKINGGAATTRSLKVRLVLRATDPAPGSGVSSVRISNDGRRWSAWGAYSTRKAWTLKAGKAGTRTVFVQYRDRAGNISATVRDTIKYRR